MRAHAVFLIAVAATCAVPLHGCGPNQVSTPPQQVLLEEGVGVQPVCTIGENYDAVQRRIGAPQSSKVYGERGSGRETEYVYYGGKVIIDTVDVGSTQIVTRVSFICGPAAGTAHLSARTRQGLVLSPSPPSRQLVVEAYGTPAAFFTDFTSLDLALGISRGKSYAVKSKGQPFEYIHYPATGICFLFTGDELLKCSVEAPRKRVIWRF